MAAPFTKKEFYAILKAWMKKFDISPPPNASKGWMRRAFKAADTNKDGKVTVAELKAALDDDE